MNLNLLKKIYFYFLSKYYTKLQLIYLIYLIMLVIIKVKT